MPLQKSFSEQSHSSKRPRPRWQRHKSYPAPQTRDDSKGQKSFNHETQLSVSSATRNKLNMFHFSEQPIVQDLDTNTTNQTFDLKSSEDKENKVKDEKQIMEGASVNSAMKETPQNELKGLLKDAPTTPAGRLAMPDLIGMVDMQGVEQDVSPDERVMWNHGSNAITSSASSYRALRRSKKRARSSSPASSPAHDSANFPNQCERFDLCQVSQSLKTPQVDPGNEFWGRYALGATGASSQGPQPPALAYILCVSSPQSSRDIAMSKSESRLRRSIGRSNSCGNEWPKRRRVMAEDQVVEDVFSETFNAGPSKLSLVSALLGKVKQELPTTGFSTPNFGYSSSSPIHNTNWQNKEESSPLCKTENQIPLILKDKEYTVYQTHSDDAEVPAQPEKSRLEAGSSDYGEFDDDEFEESVVKAIRTEPVPTLRTSSMDICQQRPLLEESYLQGPVYSESPSSASLVEKDDDEFGDADEEVCAADLEDMVAKYDDLGLPVGTLSSATASAMSEVLDQMSEFPAEQNLSKCQSDDEYGDEFSALDFEVAEAAATQSLQQLNSNPIPTCTPKARAIQRYLVTNVLDSQYETPQGRLQPEKVVLVKVERSTDIKSIHLRDDWFDTPVTAKAFVHVIGTFRSGRCVIDNDHNMLILHPDHLISSTVLADSFSCMRRAVLQDRVKATNSNSPPLIYGTMLHEIFQAAMMANRWDSEWLAGIIDSVAKRHLEDLYTVKVQVPQAVEHLRSNMGELQSWASVFVSSQPKPDAIVKAAQGVSHKMCISKLLDVEEHVWSPMYGLKGNIDATVQVTMKNDKESRTLTVPLEVKTGKSVHESHQIQTALYKLLLSDRYDVEIAYGILYYMQKSEMISIPLERRELRHLIKQRNELACFVRERHAQLPAMLKREYSCNNCYAQVPCFIYHRLGDDGNGETSGMKDKFEKVVKHLSPKHKEFFLKWDDLLTKEERESLKFKRELWTMCSSEREKVGRCFSNVIIEPGSAYEELSNPKINRFSYTLVKQDARPSFSFLESQIVVGEPIVISDERGNFALANGYVTNVRRHRITVAVDRRLHNARTRGPGFDEVNNQVFASIMDTDGGSTAKLSRGEDFEPTVQYRLDKDEFSNGMANVRNNIIQVMADGPFGSREIRSLVVDLVAPRFKPHLNSYTLTDRANINIDQRRAIEKVMSAQDYALVLGMPGTGKTTTIAHIIRALALQGKSVLLTSFTHSAVDNILLKLRDDDIQILRLGSASKVSPEVQGFALLADRFNAGTFEELRGLWHDSPVVATTCLGINHPLFNERTFDYCIVDEASQITLPVCLGPIRFARTFVLVGDHYQLPPLVQNEEARAGGLDISLFKLLSDTHPSSVVYLEHQYRMCEDVMTLSNNLIYNGRLKCGTPEVAARCVTIPKMDALQSHHYSPLTLSAKQKTICIGPISGQCWLRDLLDPSTKVSFINTDSLLPMSREEAKGNRIVNSTEAKICVQLVQSLLTVGVPAPLIGVMTTYRSQISLLKHELRGHSDVEMHTADKFQGRDKEVIVLSLVRSNEAKNIGDLLKDWRRINVAFTRAKTKLLVIGSRDTLKGAGSEEMVAKFVRLMEDRHWIYDLPKGALENHLFDDFATQMTETASCKIQSGTEWREADERRKKTGNQLSVRPIGKENVRPRAEPKRAKVSERALLAGKPILRDIMHDLYGA